MVRGFLVVFNFLHSTTVQYVQVHAFGYLPSRERSSSAGPSGASVGISCSWMKQSRILCLLAGSGTEPSPWLASRGRLDLVEGEAWGQRQELAQMTISSLSTTVTLFSQQTPGSVKHPAPSH